MERWLEELEARYDYLGRLRSALLDANYEAGTVELAAPTVADVVVAQELRSELNRRILKLDAEIERVWAESRVVQRMMGVEA